MSWWCHAVDGAVGAVSALGGLAILRRLPPRRRPVNVFLGRVFPHPDDDTWAVGSYDCRHGPVWIDFGMTTKLRVDNVIVAIGRSVERYRRAVIAAHGRRQIAAVLEKIP